MTSRPRPALPIVRWMLAPLLGLGVVFLLALANRGPEWILETATSPRGLRADGTVVAVKPGRSLGPVLAANHLTTGDSTTARLRLVAHDGRSTPGSSDDLLLVEIDPGSQVGSPDTPGRFMDTDVELTLAVGGFRVKKGPGFGGAALRAFTPEARVIIDGSVVGLRREPGMTRIDVYEGVVRVGSRAGGAPVRVGAGRAAVIREGALPAETAIDSVESRRLARFMTRRPAPAGPAGTAGGTSPG